MSDTVHIAGYVHDEDDEWYPIGVCDPGEHDGDHYANREADVPTGVWARWIAANGEWGAAREAVIDAAGWREDLPICDRTEFDDGVDAPQVTVASIPADPERAEWPAGGRPASILTAYGPESYLEVQSAIDELPDPFPIMPYGTKVLWFKKADIVIDHQPAHRRRFRSSCDECGHPVDDHVGRQVTTERND